MLMKYFALVAVVMSFTAKASPNLSMKDRLRMHLWAYGLEDKPIKKKIQPQRILPEEIERPLKKI